MKKCPYCGKAYADELTFCPADQERLQSMDSAPYFPVRLLAPCPICGSQAGFTPIADPRSSFSFPLFFTGGLIAIIFRNAGRETLVRCHACNGRYGIRTRASKIARILFWLTMIPIILYGAFLLVKFFTMMYSR